MSMDAEHQTQGPVRVGLAGYGYGGRTSPATVDAVMVALPIALHLASR